MKAAREAATPPTRGKGKKRAALVDSPDLVRGIPPALQSKEWDPVALGESESGNEI